MDSWHVGTPASRGRMNWNSSRKLFGWRCSGVSAALSRRAARTRLRRCCAVAVRVGVAASASARRRRRSARSRQRSASCSASVSRAPTERGGGHRLAQGRLVGAAHQLADVLHLAAPALVRLGALEGEDRLAQRARASRQPPAVFGGQLAEFAAELLQGLRTRAFSFVLLGDVGVGRAGCRCRGAVLLGGAWLGVGGGPIS